MSDLQTLLALLAVLYLVDCLSWVRRGGAALRTVSGRRWRLVSRSAGLANDQGDLHWHNPLPAPGTLHVLRIPPLAMSPDGILSGTSEVLPGQGRPGHSGRWLPWESIRSVQADNKWLLVNGERFCRHDSPHEPLRWARELNFLRDLPASDRADRIQNCLGQSFDRAAFARDRTAFCEVVRPVRVWSAYLFALLFGAFPAVLWMFRPLPALWFLLAALVGLLVGTGRSFWRAHRALFPDAGDERFRLGLVLALAPFSAIRAPDAMARSALERFHPLVGALELLPPDEAVAWGRRVWRDLNHPLLPEFPPGPPAASAAARWFRELEKWHVETLLAASGVDLKDIALPLPPSEPVNTLHCERCEGQFTAAATRCADCGGRPLVPL